MFRDIFLMEKDIAWLLTDLVTVDGKLPTGSPSSQTIVFWAYRDMFEKELEIFAEFGKDFEQKKKEEIFKILEKNPYNDTMN